MGCYSGSTGTRPTASSAGAKQKQGDGVEGEALSDLQALFSTTLGSDSSLRPLCLLTPGPVMGETKAYKPQQGNLVLLEVLAL